MDQVEEIVRKSIFNDTYTKGAPESDRYTTSHHIALECTFQAKYTMNFNGPSKPKPKTLCI